MVYKTRAFDKPRFSNFTDIQTNKDILHFESNISCVGNSICSELLNHLAVVNENDSRYFSDMPIIGVKLTKSNRLTYPVIMNGTENCTEYATQLLRRFVTYTNVVNTWEGSADIGDVTILTQTSTDRLDSLKRLILSWDGPVSATLYAENWLDIAAQLVQWIHNIQRKNIQLHVVVQSGYYYPVNFLRNVAQSNAKTQYVFMVDVDFWPMPDLYANLKNHLTVFYKQHPGNRLALVIPAFQFDGNGSIPANKNDLNSTWQKHVKSFRQDFSLRNGALFERWIDSQEDIPQRLSYEKRNAEFYY